MEQETLSLDGRKFHGVSQEITANQDDFILAHLRQAGAIDVLHGFDGVERTQEKKAEDLLTTIMLAGKTYDVLAGCLTEVGKAWTRETALKNAATFGEITDPAEKLAMRSAIVNFVLGFFSSGEPSSGTSPKSSSQSGRVPHTKSAARATSGTSPK